jgi:hypothetical protein
MSEQRTLRPASGRLVRHPGEDKRPLDPNGELVEFNSYWRRKMSAGDVVEVVTPSADKPEKGGAK